MGKISFSLGALLTITLSDHISHAPIYFKAQPRLIVNYDMTDQQCMLTYIQIARDVSIYICVVRNSLRVILYLLFQSHKLIGKEN